MLFKASIILLALTAGSIAAPIDRPAGVRALEIRDAYIGKEFVAELDVPPAGIDKRGMAASQARLLMLTARISDIELQLQFIHQALLQISDIQAAVGDRKDLSNVRLALTNQEANLQAQRDAVQAEIETVQKILQNNIEQSFKISPQGTN